MNLKCRLLLLALAALLASPAIGWAWGDPLCRHGECVFYVVEARRP